MARKRGNDPSTGSNAKNDGNKKTCLMGNIWELCLTGLDYDRLDKAFGDHCREKNITTKDFFLRWNDGERAAGWNEIVNKLPSDLIETITSIMAESSSAKTATKTNEATAETIPSGSTTDTTTTTPTTTTTSANTITTMAMTPDAPNMSTINATITTPLSTDDDPTMTRMTPPENTPTATMTLSTAFLPNPTNDIMFAGLFGLLDAEKKKFKKSQEKALRKVEHGIQIDDENKELLREHRDLGIILTTPERKPGELSL
jgi:hypothetical protein